MKDDGIRIKRPGSWNFYYWAVGVTRFPVPGMWRQPRLHLRKLQDMDTSLCGLPLIEEIRSYPMPLILLCRKCIPDFAYGEIREGGIQLHRAEQLPLDV